MVRATRCRMTSSTDSAALIKGARVEIIEEAGHYPWLEQSGKVARRWSRPSCTSDAVVEVRERCQDGSELLSG